MPKASKLPYLQRRRDRPGWFFVRRVPADIKSQVGRTFWKKHLAPDLATARLRLPEEVKRTDEEIALIRAGGARKALPARPGYVSFTQPRDVAKELLRGQPAPEIFDDEVFFGSPEEAEYLASQPPKLCAGRSRLVVPMDLLALGKRLKSPARQTELAWRRALKDLTNFLGHEGLHLVCRQDAQRYRDLLLERLQVPTVKTRIHSISGLYNLAVEESLLELNPFAGVTKRLKIEKAPQVAVDISACDQKIELLPSDQSLIYQLLRWSGLRLAEVLGIEKTDFDIENQLIHVVPKPDRPLKTQQSQRVVPIHTQISGLVAQLVQGEDRPFARYYNASEARWGGGIIWRPKIGINPHGLRHHAVTCMRSEGISEAVIGAVLGHVTPGITAQYGAVEMEIKRKAIACIK